MSRLVARIERCIVEVLEPFQLLPLVAVGRVAGVDRLLRILLVKLLDLQGEGLAGAQVVNPHAHCMDRTKGWMRRVACLHDPAEEVGATCRHH